MLKTKIQNVDRKSLWGKKHIFQGKRSNTVPPGPGLGCDESWLRGGEGGGGAWLNPGQLCAVTHPAPRSIWKACDHSSPPRLWLRIGLVSQTHRFIPGAGLDLQQQHVQQCVCTHLRVDKKKIQNTWADWKMGQTNTYSLKFTCTCPHTLTVMGLLCPPK